MRGGCLSAAAVDAAAVSLDAAESPLPPDPEFLTGADFAAEFEARFAAWTAVEAAPPYPGPTDNPVRHVAPPGTATGPGGRVLGAAAGSVGGWWVDGPDPDDLDECDLVPYEAGQVSRVDVLEWELFGAQERDAAEGALLAERAPGWVSLPPGGELAAALETLRPSTESPIALVEAMRACDRQIAWLESVKLAGIGSFVRQRAHEAATEPYARGVEELSGRPMDPERSCAAELAAALGVSPNTIGPRIEAARRLTTDLHDTYAALRCGTITVSKALSLLEATKHLPVPAQRQVEAGVLGRAPDQVARQTHARFRAALRRAVAKVDTRGHTRRHRDAVRDRDCRRYDLLDGMAGLWLTHSADQIQQAWLAIQALADRVTTDDPGDARTAGQRRADAAVDVFARILGNGTDWLERPLPTNQRRRPQIEVTVPATTLLGLDDQPGELAGYGPIPAELARRIAAEGTWRRLLTDPATGVVLEAATSRHDPPAQVSQTLLARHPTCSWIGCPRPALRCDRDHGRKYRHTGQTRLDDLRPYCRYHHVIKDNDHWGWAVQNLPDGTTRITAPTGHVYLTHPPARGPIIEDTGRSSDSVADPPNSTGVPNDAGIPGSIGVPDSTGMPGSTGVPDSVGCTDDPDPPPF